MAQTLKKDNSVDVDKNAVLRKALIYARDSLELSNDDIARIIECHPADVNSVCVDTDVGKMALRFLRMFRSLDSLYGGHEENAKNWFHYYNKRLNGKPSELVCTPEGLEQVTRVLDSYRDNFA